MPTGSVDFRSTASPRANERWRSSTARISRCSPTCWSAPALDHRRDLQRRRQLRPQPGRALDRDRQHGADHDHAQCLGPTSTHGPDNHDHRDRRSPGGIGTPTGTVTFSIDGTPQTPAQPSRSSAAGYRHVHRRTLALGHPDHHRDLQRRQHLRLELGIHPCDQLGTAHGGADQRVRPCRGFRFPGRHHGRARRQPLVHRERPRRYRDDQSRRPRPSPSSPSPTAGDGPTSITAGPDGNLWFTEVASTRSG